LRELDSELAAGTLGEAQYKTARSELEDRVVQDTSLVEQAATVSSGSRWPAVVVALAVPVLAILLYQWLGNTHWADVQENPPQVAQSQGHALTPEMIQTMISQLQQKLQNEPNNAENWVMLARSYGFLKSYKEASAAYARAVELLPDDAALLADYADNLAMANGRTLQGEPDQLIQRALKLDPNNVKVLALAGSVAFERKDYQGAINQWQKILALEPPDSQMATTIGASVNEARSLAGLGPAEAKSSAGRPSSPGNSAAATVSGTVQLDPALKGQVADTNTVFIFARAADGSRGPPLAVLHKTVKDLPISFTLDDSMAMAPAFKLSTVAQVVIGARISKSGQATPSQGDLEGYSQPVNVGANGVSFTINSTVK
jgi:cytochrome c-type biogenesis protein CcmH